jgi:hypothetical protein
MITVDDSRAQALAEFEDGYSVTAGSLLPETFVEQVQRSTEKAFKSSPACGSCRTSVLESADMRVARQGLCRSVQHRRSAVGCFRSTGFHPAAHSLRSGFASA